MYLSSSASTAHTITLVTPSPASLDTAVVSLTPSLQNMTTIIQPRTGIPSKLFFPVINGTRVYVFNTSGMYRIMIIIILTTCRPGIG